MRRRRIGSLAAAVGLLTLGAALAAAAETPIPPPPQRWVTDRAGFLSRAAADELDARLADYERRTGHQILVYIDQTTGGVPIEDWAVRAFQQWRVGRRGIDDGAVLFVFAGDRRARIEVGYGLEDRVPDAVAKRIIEERIIPRIRAGDHDGAIRDGVAALTAAMGGAGAGAGAGAAAPEPPRAPVLPSAWKLIAGAVLLLIFVVFAITHPALAWMMLLSIGSGRGGGGGWGGGGGGGGGFSGGGGRSGGGGASGSW
jgi:uncharacterized protein